MATIHGQTSSFTKSLTDYQRQFYENREKNSSLLGRVTTTVLGRALSLGISFLLHAEAVCRAVYICFLSIRETFSSTDEELLARQKGNCYKAYEASWFAFLGIGEKKTETTPIVKAVKTVSKPLFAPVHKELVQTPSIPDIHIIEPSLLVEHPQPVLVEEEPPEDIERISHGLSDFVSDYEGRSSPLNLPTSAGEAETLSLGSDSPLFRPRDTRPPSPAPRIEAAHQASPPEKAAISDRHSDSSDSGNFGDDSHGSDSEDSDFQFGVKSIHSSQDTQDTEELLKRNKTEPDSEEDWEALELEIMENLARQTSDVDDVDLEKSDHTEGELLQNMRESVHHIETQEHEWSLRAVMGRLFN